MSVAASSTFADDETATVSDINVTPLVDVVLVLLIVFMITVPSIVGTAPVKIDLAGDVGVLETIEYLPLNFQLVQQDGKQVLYLETLVVDNSLLARVARETPFDERVTVLTADREIPYGDVIQVMDRLAGFGLQKVSLNIKGSR